MPVGAPILIEAPASEPLTFAEVNAQRNFSIPDDQQAFTESLISMAREFLEDDLGIALLPQARQQVMDLFPCDNRLISVLRPPLQGVDWIKYTDYTGEVTNTLARSAYIVDTDSYPGRIALNYGQIWPAVTLRPVNGVRIQIRCGFRSAADVPAKLKHAMYLTIGSLYENRESVLVSERTGSVVPIVIDSSTRSAVDRLTMRYRVR